MNVRVVIAVGVVIVLCAGAIAVVTFSRISAHRRLEPPQIKPVTIGGVEYRVPNTSETEGFVEAWNTNSGKLLWKRKIYSTLKLSIFMEYDTQVNFITNMSIGPATNELTIVNEKGRQYILNTTSRKITRSKRKQVKSK